MKLGTDTIGVRNLQPVLGEDGTAVLDDFGKPQQRAVDELVDSCLVVPTTRTADTNEPPNRTAPASTGMTVYAPPGTPVAERSVVIWPITTRTEVDGQLQLDGRLWNVEGEPAIWPETVEARLQTSR